MEALRELARLHPEQLNLGWRAREAEAAVLHRNWTPMTPKELLKMACEPQEVSKVDIEPDATISVSFSEPLAELGGRVRVSNAVRRSDGLHRFCGSLEVAGNASAYHRKDC